MFVDRNTRSSCRDSGKQDYLIVGLGAVRTYSTDNGSGIREMGDLLSELSKSVTNPSEAKVEKMASHNLTTERRGSDLQNRRLSRLTNLHQLIR